MFTKIFSHVQKANEPPTSESVVGIDIGSSSIKVVELQERDNVVTLTTYGELQLGPYADGKPLGQSVTIDAGIEQQAVSDILRESAVKAKQAVVAMPLASSFVTVMTLPANDEEDISPRIRVEARKYIPIPISNVMLDWVVLNDATNPNTEGVYNYEILVAAIHNEALGRTTSLLSTLSFNGAPTEIECFSTIRSAYNSDSPVTAIIDVGAVSTKLYILNEGMLYRMHRVRGGGSLCTEQYAKDNNIEFEEAETIKRFLTKEDKNFVAFQKIYHNHFIRQLKEFVHVMNEFKRSTGNEVTAVTLAGGASQFPGFQQYVSDTLSLPTSINEPFDKVAYPAFMEDTLRSIGPSFSTALGAALRHFE